MRNILVFSLAYDPYLGGAEIALREIMRRLPQFRFTVITARALKNFRIENVPEVEERGNVRVVRVGARNRYFGQYGYPWSAVKRAFSEARFQKPAAVWGMMESYGGMAAAMFHQKFPQIPYMLTMQSGDPARFWALRTWFWKPWYRRVFTHAAAIQAISHFLAARARAMGARGRIEVIPNGVDVENFSSPISTEERSALRHQWGLSDDGVAVITASRLVEKNGIDTLVRGYARWRKSKHGSHHDRSGINNYSLSGVPIAKRIGTESKGIPAALVIAGKGPQGNRLRRLARQEGIEGEAKFLGEIPYRDLPLYYQSADVFVRPSRSEGLGNAFLEAMAAGLPVIGTPVGGIPDFLRDGETGLVVAPDDPQGLTAAIERLSSSTALRQKLIERGKKMVTERYSWDGVTTHMGELFGRVITEGQLKIRSYK